MSQSPRRITVQQRALRGALAATDEFVTAQELHESLREAGVRIGLATVYRILAELVAAGQLDTMRSPAGETRYRQCEVTGHHHHLVCRGCGRTEEVTAPAVERWARSVADQFDFCEVDHEVELTGMCRACAQQ